MSSRDSYLHVESEFLILTRFVWKLQSTGSEGLCLTLFQFTKWRFKGKPDHSTYPIAREGSLTFAEDESSGERFDSIKLGITTWLTVVGLDRVRSDRIERSSAILACHYLTYFVLI